MAVEGSSASLRGGIREAEADVDGETKPAALVQWMRTGRRMSSQAGGRRWGGGREDDGRVCRPVKRWRLGGHTGR
jgi:hypothetical protein